MEDVLTQVAASPWALAVLFLLVVGDAFLVVVPGETAVTAFGALAVTEGAPSLTSVIAVAAVAALLGDVACYLVGRRIGLNRWRWMRGARVRTALGWARRRLDDRAALVLFTARFVPFARLTVNLAAGASGLPVPRYLLIATLAACGWSLYQALIGAVIASVLPGGPVVAVVVSVIVAILLGVVLDLLLSRIRLGAPVPLGAAVAPDVATAGQTGRERRMTMTQPASSETGYIPDFLDVTVPLPRPLDDRRLVDLPYPHFSVTLDTDRRFAAVTGVNIDGATLLDLSRTGEWDLDPRVPADAQAGPAVYSRNDLDRGHLVRRRDPGWGETAQARAATEATFFYTNAAPQAASFNQSKELWLGLEDHVLAFAEATDLRVSVFTAPVLDDEDPPYRGILIPRRFWKVAAWVSDDGALAAAGFVLDQSDLIDTTQASAVAGPILAGFRTFQVPIAGIGDLAGIGFGPLVSADVLTEAVRAAPWRELTGAGDIRL